MNLSFDLDGVLAETCNGMLGLLHNAVRFEWPGAHEDLIQYYARRPLLLDARLLLASHDDMHIITGRVPMAHEVTQRWVQRFYPRAHLVCVSDEYVARMFDCGGYTEASEELAKRKIQAIKQCGSVVHFDNNPVIVRRVRESGVVAVLVGGGIDDGVV